MGWARTLLLGDVGNRLDIADCEREIASFQRHQQFQRRVDRSQDQQLKELEEDVGELKLYLAAVVRLLTVGGTLDRAELTRLVEMIDKSDGQSDGQYNGPLDERPA